MKKQEILFGSWLYAMNVSRKEIMSEALDANVFRILSGNETATFYLKRCSTPKTVGGADVYRFVLTEKDLREIDSYGVNRLGLFAVRDELNGSFEVAILSLQELKACIGADRVNTSQVFLKIVGGREFRIFGNALPEVSAIAIPRNRVGGDMNGGLKSNIVCFEREIQKTSHSRQLENRFHEIADLGSEPFTVRKVAEKLGLSIPGARLKAISWLEAGLTREHHRQSMGRGRPTIFYVWQRDLAA